MGVKRSLPDLSYVNQGYAIVTCHIAAAVGLTLGVWGLAFFRDLYAGPAPVFAYFFGLLVIALMAFIVIFRRRMRELKTALGQGLDALARGHFKRARELFWTWSERAPGASGKAFAYYSLASSLMYEGELEHAIAMLVDNRQHHLPNMVPTGIARFSAADLALCHALLGKLDEAKQWLAKTEHTSASIDTVHVRNSIAFARAVMDARPGGYSEAVRVLEAQWPELESGLVDGLRRARVVRAFATAMGDARDIGKAQKLLENLAPKYPGEFDFLGVAWPEMAQFLNAHDLATR